MVKITRDLLGLSEKEYRLIRAALLLRAGNRCERDGCGYTSKSGKGLTIYADEPTARTYEMVLLCRGCYEERKE